MKNYEFDKMGGIWVDQARDITKRASLSHILEIGIYGATAALFTVSRLKAPAAALPFGVPCPICGGICTTCATSADIPS